MHRVGIIPFDVRDNLTALLFVTSMSRGRWILPKGLAKKGETHHDTCHREGFEEAGVKGVLLKDFPITALVSKSTKTGVKKIPVTYYPYLVSEQADDWPEKERRQRHWALLEDAPKVAYRDDFLGVIKQFEELAPWIRKSASKHKAQPPAAPQPAL